MSKIAETLETKDAGGGSDISRTHWAYRFAPTATHPYLTLIRIDRPIGTWLLLLPCWWGLALAGGVAGLNLGTGLAYALLFAIGAFVMRSAGCVWNDILDRDYDRRVERTRERPIASGTVSVRGGAVFMVGLALIGLLVLLQFNRFTIWLAVGSLGLVVFYPLMKRVTYWPQAWLGLTFNWGALVGWAAVMEGLAPAALLLYLSGFCWTLGYDTIYAHQDKEDDLMVGIRSTALLFGARTKTWLALFYGGAMLLLAGAGYFAGLEALFLVGLLIGAAQLAWQVHALDPEDPGDCLRKFKSNLWFGLLVTAAILAAAS